MEQEAVVAAAEEAEALEGAEEEVAEEEVEVEGEEAVELAWALARIRGWTLVPQLSGRSVKTT